VILLACVLSGGCHAGLMVSPVKVEAHDVSVGDEIVLNLAELAGQEQELHFSLGLFDQDEFGGVVLREDPESQAWAAKIIELSHSKIILAPYQQADIRLTINRADYASSYIVVFVTPKRSSGVSSRLAVLLLLSTEGAAEAIALTDVDFTSDKVLITFQNSGSRHGRGEGTLALYDESGLLLGEEYVDTGTILPGCHRRSEIPLHESLSPVYFTFQARELGRQQYAAEGLW